MHAYYIDASVPTDHAATFVAPLDNGPVFVIDTTEGTVRAVIPLDEIVAAVGEMAPVERVDLALADIIARRGQGHRFDGVVGVDLVAFTFEPLPGYPTTNPGTVRYRCSTNGHISWRAAGAAGTRCPEAPCNGVLEQDD